MSLYQVYYASISGSKMGGGTAEVEASSPQEAAARVIEEKPTVRIMYVVNETTQEVTSFAGNLGL